MLTVINQIKRLRTDDGRNDKSFDGEIYKLETALKKVKSATDEFIRAAQRLYYELNSDNGFKH